MNSTTYDTDRLEQILRETEQASDGRLERIRSRVLSAEIEQHPHRSSKSGRPWLAAAAAAVVVLAVVMLLVPPVRQLSAQVVSRVGSFVSGTLFPRTSDERVRMDELGGDTDGASVEAADAVALREIAPFDVVIPDFDLPTLEVIGFSYNATRNVSAQLYRTRTRSIRLSQQPIADAERAGLLLFGFDLVIPEDAPVRTVSVGGEEAELIRGMWYEDGAENGEVVFRWDEDAFFATLRWRSERSIFEIQLRPTSAGVRSSWLEEEIIELGEQVVAAQ